jgi:hypothetical protein
MKPNFAYTLQEVEQDMQRVFDSGYFSKCQSVAEDTRDGVRLTFEASSLLVFQCRAALVECLCMFVEKGGFVPSSLYT